MNYLALRRLNLLRGLKKEKDGPDAVLITAPVNVTYLTGFTGEASYLVVTPKHAILVSDQRFEDQIKEECLEGTPGHPRPKDDNLEAVFRPHDQTTAEAAAEVLGKAGAKAVAVEGNRLTVGELTALRELAPKLTLAPLNNMVESLRAVKDASEREHIQEAVRVAERAFKMFVATLREGDTEKDMVDALEGYIRRAGAKGSSFRPIVAAGERGALPHAPPTAKTLGEASKLLIDWGAELLYKSDLTRTIRSPFQPAPSRRNKFERTEYKFEEVYEVVLNAQKAALAVVRDGVKAKDVDAAARKVIDKAGYGDYFTHGLGHGIGLEVHEAPRVRANSEDVLEAGMVITIEPAVYIPGWGGVRIEDDVVVQREGCAMLSTLPHEPVVG